MPFQMQFFAHSLPGGDCAHWQSLQEHLLAVAELAKCRGHKFGVGGAAMLSGLLHDLGKYTDGFQERLRGGVAVDHATAGARFIRDIAGASGEARIMAQIVAHCIAGHHGGLPDSIGGLRERLNEKELERLDAQWREEIHPDAALLTKPSFNWRKDKDEHLFQLGFLGRMIFSCLVDADFRDTEAFYAKAEGIPRDREWPALPNIVDGLIGKLDARLVNLVSAAADTEVNRLRKNILVHARASAERPRGAFSLNVPTGGGKTLSSLAFALDHARRHELERIVYAIPYTSVIDQTAAIFKDILGADVVLEHHSSIDEEKLGDRSARDKLRLAMEDWAAPIIVTTNVQLFESLHSHRPSRCRRLHNLANSVIILDEAQTIPLPVLRPCVAALDELTRNYGVSAVICTATQPAIAARDFKRGLKLGPERELAPDPADLHEKLRRVEILDAGMLEDGALLDQLAAQEQGLVIVNSRAHALALFRAAQDLGLDGATHLSTRQCAAHRRVILADTSARLKAGAPCRLVATSLIEAGVDLDFPRLWRARAGLDQIAQAAGRCNREGKRPRQDSIVTIFDSPDRKPPHEIGLLIEGMARTAGRHPDILSPEAIKAYFEEVYWQKGEERLDKFDVLRSFRASAGELDFNYKTIGESFRLIDSAMDPVIIDWAGGAKGALDKLQRGLVSPGATARAMQNYIVQIPPRARAQLLANGHIRFVEPPGEKGEAPSGQFALLTNDRLYRPDFGLFWENADDLGIEGGTIW